MQLKINALNIIKNEQLFQQEAYPATWRPVDVHNSAIPGTIFPK